MTRRQGEHGKQAGAEDSDGELSESEEDEDPPQLHVVKVAHHGGVNRVRSMPQEAGIISSWGDTGHVQVCAPLPACAARRLLHLPPEGTAPRRLRRGRMHGQCAALAD